MINRRPAELSATWLGTHADHKRSDDFVMQNFLCETVDDKWKHHTQLSVSLFGDSQSWLWSKMLPGSNLQIIRFFFLPVRGAVTVDETNKCCQYNMGSGLGDKTLATTKGKAVKLFILLVRIPGQNGWHVYTRTVRQRKIYIRKWSHCGEYIMSSATSIAWNWTLTTPGNNEIMAGKSY